MISRTKTSDYFPHNNKLQRITHHMPKLSRLVKGTLDHPEVPTWDVEQHMGLEQDCEAIGKL